MNLAYFSKLGKFNLANLRLVNAGAYEGRCQNKRFAKFSTSKCTSMTFLERFFRGPKKAGVKNIKLKIEFPD